MDGVTHEDERVPQKQPAASLAVTKADLDNVARTKAQLPDQAKLLQLRQALKAISDRLDEVDDTVLEILEGSDEVFDGQGSSGSSTSSTNPVEVSIDLHLADLQRISSALCKLVSKYRPERPRSAKGDTCFSARSTLAIPDIPTSALDDQASEMSLPDPVTPDQHACGCLPAPELSLFSCSQASLTTDDDKPSAYSQDHSRDLTSSPPQLQIRLQRHTSSPATMNTPPSPLAPLNLRSRSFYTRSATSLRHQAEGQNKRAFSSPFDYELGYLDGQMGESSSSSSSGLGGRLPPDPDQGRLSSDSRCGLEPIGEVEAGHIDDGLLFLQRGRYRNPRHFITGEKTGRLQSRRRGSAPSAGGTVARFAAEPLPMEDLMAFLREGNSIREL